MQVKPSPAAQGALRLRIADFLRKGNRTQVEAPHIIQVSLPGAKKLWKQFKSGGKKALRQKKRGPQNSHSGLCEKKAKQIKAIIKTDTPDSTTSPLPVDGFVF